MRALRERGALAIGRAALLGAAACAVVAAGVVLVTAPDGDGPVTRSPAPSVSATPPALSATATGRSMFPTAPYGYAPLGARMTVTVRPARLVGEVTEAVVHVTDNDGYLEGITVDYGDGEREENPSRIPDSALCLAHPPAPGHAPEPSDETKTFLHVYLASGAHTVQVTAITPKGYRHGLSLRLRETADALIPSAVSGG